MPKPAVGMLLWTACLIGCGGDTPAKYPVSGTVQLQDRPLSQGIVMFVPDEGPAAMAPVDAHGRYELMAVAGRNRVSVRPNAAVSAPEVLDQQAGQAEHPAVEIPAVYHRYDTSGLEAEVMPDEDNVIDLSL